MKNYYYLLISVFCLLATACGPECNQGWGDSNRSHKVHIYASNPTDEGDPSSVGATEVLRLLCEEDPDYEGVDVITRCEYEKKNIGDDFELCLSTSKDFSHSLMEDTFFSGGCANIHDQTGEFNLALEVSVPIYAYVVFTTGERTGIQQVRFYNEENEDAVPMQCDGFYRLAQTTLIKESITMLASPIEGVMLTRHNDSGICTLENTGGNRVHVAVYPDGEENPVLEVEGLAAGKTQDVNCNLIDQVTYLVKVWALDFDTDLDNILNSINETHPAEVDSCVWDSSKTSITCETLSSVETQPLEISTAGVTCIIVVDNLDESDQAELACENGSSTSVEVQLYRLKSNDVTEATYLRDFEVASFSLGGSGGATDNDTSKFDLDSGNYQIVIVEEFLYYNGDEVGSTAFTAGRQNNEWVITTLPENSVID